MRPESDDIGEFAAQQARPNTGIIALTADGEEFSAIVE